MASTSPCISADAPGIGVDTASDLERVRRLFV
jgi:CMP-2-keto-3-deoxyoctulosonic acid synthetase